MRHATLVIVCAALLMILSGPALAVRPSAELSWDSDGVVTNLSQVTEEVTCLHVKLLDVHDVQEVSLDVVWSYWGTCFPGYRLVSSPALQGCGWLGEAKTGTLVRQAGTSWTIELGECPAQADCMYLAFRIPGNKLPVEGTFCLKNVVVTDSEGHTTKLDTPNVATIRGGAAPRAVRSSDKKEPEHTATATQAESGVLGNLQREYANALLQNHPSPFSGISGTTIHYTAAEPGSAKLRIFGATGRLVRTIDARAHRGENSVVWDGTAEDGTIASSGVYFYEIKMKGFRDHRKTVLLR